MEIITKKYQVFQFDELKEEIKEKLIKKIKEQKLDNYCEYCLYDDMKEKAEELLQKYFKNNRPEFIHVYYDLSYCQGDGAMIVFDLYYYNKYIKIKHVGNYYHERSFIIETYELTEKQEKQLKEKIIKMNEELTKFGYNLIETYPDDTTCIELLKENKYLQNGDIFYD